MQSIMKKTTAFLLCALLILSGLTVFAETQSKQTSHNSELSKVTASTTLNSDGSIALSGTADIFGWIEKVVILKGDRTADAAAAYSSSDVIASEAVSGLMKYDYSFTLKKSKVTTAGYTVIAADAGAKAWAAAYVASPAGTVEGEGGTEDPGDIDDGTSYGPGKINGTCTITSAGKVKVKLSVDMPAYIDEVRWVKGNHIEDAESIVKTGKLIAEYYNPDAPVSIPDYLNAYSFSALLSGDDVSEEGYTFAVIDAFGKNVSAKYIPTKEFSTNPDDYPNLDHNSSVWLPEVKLVLIANGSYIAADVAPLVDGMTNTGFEPPFIQDKTLHYLDTDSTYVVVFHTDYRWITSSPAACILEVDPHGCVTIKGATYNAGKVTEAENKCTLSATTGGIAVGYTGSKQPEKTVFAYDIPDAPTDGGVYGAGVDDATLDSWATIKVNNPLKTDGGERQAFSVNYVKDLIAGLGVPARNSGIDGLKEEMISYYSSEKPLWVDYMYRDTYQYSDLYLHDVYCQGVWDSMPAAYGWKQDQYTEPGKYSNQKYSLAGKSYGLAGGGQNPWVLVDYIERNAGVAGTAGEGWQYGYDEVAQCPYIWNAEYGIFLSYENKRSLQARCDYLLKNNLGGIIIWEMSGDNTGSYPLTSLIYNNLRKGKSEAEQKRIIGYFVNWAVYNPYHQYQSPDDLPWDKMTHINYSFFDVSDDNTIYTMDGWADTDVGGKEMFEEAKKMKEEYPDTKLIVSVGGWTRGNNFGKMVSTKASRDTFVNSVVNFLKTYPYFDGIDLDWEYPGCGRAPDFDDPNDRGCGVSDNDAENYALLCEELRAALDSNFGSQGRNSLSACVPANPLNIQTTDSNGKVTVKQDIVRVANACDFINLMTYDFHGAFDPVIGYNSPLYTPKGFTVDNDGSRAWSTAFAVDFFVNTMGIKPEKISIGTPYYSRGWAGVKTDKNGVPMGLQDPTPFDADPVDPDEPDVTEESDIFVFKLDDKNAYYYNQDMKLPIDGPATYVNGKTYVPFRAVAAAAGITDVKFSNGIITFTGAEGINVKMAIDSTTCVLTLGNQNMNMTIAAPTYVGGVAMLPVRDTASLTGASIVFDNSGYVVVSPDAIDNSKVSAYINAFNKK